MINADRSAFKMLDAHIERNLHFYNAPGVVIGLTDRSKTLHIATYGYADLAAQNPVEAKHLFEIGSISKSFTSILILQLQERGILDVDSPIERYLPWLRIRSAYDEPIRLHHLMTHTAGIINGRDAHVNALEEAWELMEYETSSQPGSYYHYSNSGYKILGLVLQEVLGKDMAEILKENILSQLGMHATEPVITNDTRLSMATGYEPFYDDRPLPLGGMLAPATWLEYAAADGAICSDVTDMCRFLRMLLNQGAGVLSKSSFNAFTEPYILTGSDYLGEHYGYGLVIGERNGHLHLSHSGGMVGYYAYIDVDLVAGLGVVVLVNGPAVHTPWDIETLAHYTLQLSHAEITGEALPYPDLENLRSNPDTEKFTGLYQAGEKSFFISDREGCLVLEYENNHSTLERRESDQYFINHGAFNRFLLSFGWQNGQVVEAYHGSDCYIREGHNGTPNEKFPRTWFSYTGHYRSHNPWYSNFRIVLRKSNLLLIYPSGEEEVLVPLSDNTFRIGEDPRSPERIEFDMLHGDLTYRSYLSGGEYCRTFTP